VSFPFATRHTAALLAATYLVVGATGESLYYLVESPSIARAADASSRDGYFHDHGDGLWHRHAAGQRVDAAGDRHREPMARRDASRPHDHTCFLLAVAAAIELSVSAGAASLEAPVVGRPAGLGIEDRAVSSGSASLGARGPPRANA